MSSAEVIDALFERTVDIVQSLPKAGAIQTSYEEKLALYSLYKQATEGDVTSRRPGMLDMLGRAKWDAWSSRRGLSSQDAKQLYVESMLRTLRKFADRPQAIALIEELESYSGDVAQRVMSASLARAGSDSDSDSRPRSPVAIPVPDTETDSEDERDAVAQLPPAMASASASRPSSAQATRGGRSVGGGSGGRRTPQGGSVSGGLPQRYAVPPSRVPRAPPSAASRTPAPLATDSEDSDESLAAREERQRRGSQQPSINTPRGAPRAAQYYAGAGPPAPRYATPQSWSRGPGSVTGGEGRLYAPPNAPRMPPSESMGGGGAGTSMYSAVPPSRAPPSEQHYYHHAGSVRPGAPSSIGARSGGAPSHRGAVQPQRAEVDTALQSIQASLAALHERLNRVEETRRSGLSAALFGPSGAGAADGNGGRRGALRKAYGALTDALHDIAVLLGLGAASRTGTAAPSYLASAGSRGNGATNSGGAANQGGLGAPLRLLAAVLNLSVRLALDLTSLALLFSLIVFFVQRLTGRGDPLLLLRLMRRWRPRAAAALLPAQKTKRGEATAVAA